MPTIIDLGKQIKQQYPAYSSMSDEEVGRKVKAKDPVKYNSFSDIESAGDIWGESKTITPQVEKQKSGISFNPIENFKRGAEAVGKIGEKVFKPASEFLFGGIGKQAGKLTSTVVESAQSLAGKEPEQRQGYDIGKTAPSFGDVIGTALEGTMFGLGEKTTAKIVTKLSRPLITRAEKLYQSALKPSTALLKKSPDVVKTGLKEGVRVSEGGLNKVRGIMEDIGEEISKVIDTGIAQKKVVAKRDLLPYLDEMKEYLGNSLGGKELVRQVDDLSKKILKELPDNIPIEKAQKIKQTTQSLLSKYYSKLAPTEIEAKKQLTRGLKEEIANQVPEIRALNARDSKLYGLEDALEAAMKRIGNKNIIGLGDMFALGSGGVTGGKKGAGTVLLLKKILLNPTTKSGGAILLNDIANNAAKAFQAGRITTGVALSKVIDLFSKD